MTKKTHLIKFAFRAFGIILFLITTQHPVHAQVTAKNNKLKTYKIWIKGATVAQGLLYDVTDSSIFIAQNLNSIKPVEYKIATIKTMKIRKVNIIKTGAFLGLSIGLISGFVVGATNISSEGSKVGTILTSGMILGTLGALGGILITAPKRVLISHSNNGMYLVHQKKLKSYSLKFQGL